ncbi:NAD(P)H-binding protein [Rhodococcus sp. (in: high G+C Gram-positive bacteria)]|uniref:NAD(P)H-binding protein n=1 Tax=Rhodococcus sp. TaxID=1831 RepID=UPI003890BFEE
MASTCITVTGSTGNIGRAVAAHLAETGTRMRLVVRDPARAPAGARDVVQASYRDLEAATAALRGADVLFMVSASESADRLTQHRTFVDAAAAAGVRHVVYTSYLGAAPNATFTLARDHWATEQYLRESGMAWTFLRDSLYLDFLPTLADEDGVIRGPAGDGRVGAVARADIAQRRCRARGRRCSCRPDL